ncbi:MAG: squalene synthase HpnC [Phycisphaerae bacterium]|nr:squalene synthase HpnC [Phycisphaerae bacterium]
MASPLTDVRAALPRFGPERCETVSLEEARAWCRALAWGHYENFSVLSGLVPHDLRDDFGAVYAFCRWSDDLGDEVPAETAPASPEARRERALELLAWWRRELEACYAGSPRHPIFVALLPTIRRHNLPADLFHRLISAFELDQTKTRYATWEELIAYCRDSADPVGRLVLMMLGEPRDDERFRRSDQICTALQLTNHWQDIRRDLEERDRIYVPADLNPIERFEERLRATVAQGHSIDPTFFGESRTLVRSLVEKTWPLFEEGATLIDTLAPRSRPVVWLFLQGGVRTLRQIELWNCETVLHRPYLSKFTKLLLVGQARVMAWRLRGAPTPMAAPLAGGAA